jgi:hypothetical protein
MKPDEGFAVAAVGLGQYVVDGEQAYRFSPSYPKLEIASTKDLVKSSQVKFYAVDLENNEVDLTEGSDAGLTKLDIDVAEKHGNLKHCASVYDPDNDRIEPGLDAYGPRIVNFANILKLDYIPLAKTINTILDVVKEALGTQVEIEWAVDLEKDKDNLPSFYLLQIKPLVFHEEEIDLHIEELNTEDLVLYSEKSMGNGKIDHITDVIYVDKEKFDNNKTLEMTYEIEKLNKQMREKNKKYILVGPGRWGTRDKFIGIPVVWSQISQAKVIVEVGLKNFPLDASLGSHFFHNVTSMNVGYFSISDKSRNSFVDWDKLKKQKIVEETTYFKHIEFSEPLTVYMDGKKMVSAIYCPDSENNCN